MEALDDDFSPGVEASQPLNLAHLFEPIQYRGKTIPTRFALAPINTGYTERGRPTSQLFRFHSDRAGSGIGISMVGNVAVDEGGRTNPATAVLNREDDVGSYAALAKVITDRGALAGIQLALSPENLSPTRRWRPAKFDDELARLRGIVSAYSEDEIAEKLSHFHVAAKLSVRAGFEIVQLHAAHGYFLSLLLHTATNARNDYYAQNRQWFEELLTEIKSLLGSSLLSLRLSALTGIVGEDEEIELARTLVKRAESAGTDVVDLSAGFYTYDRRYIYPDKHWNEPIYWARLDEITEGSSILVTVAGRIVDPERIPSVGQNVILSLGRALIADPEFVAKIRAGALAGINHCRLTNRCHYFSRGVRSMECGVNPNL